MSSHESFKRSFISSLLWKTFVFCALFAQLDSSIALSSQSLAEEPTYEEMLTGEAFIFNLEPDKRGGKAYKLVYLVDVPISVLWRFKTDFDTDFLLTHKFITKHRFVGREQNGFITETEYTNTPGALFRWRTILFPSIHRMDFFLENPQECGQEFHYGHIQLTAQGQQTKVTQVAYFDFLGVTLWVHYPWKGGMTEFLEYTARWEQETVIRLQGSYLEEASEQETVGSKD